MTATASFGVSKVSFDGANKNNIASRFDDAMKTADSLLYEAKKNGRNSVVSDWSVEAEKAKEPKNTHGWRYKP